MSYFAEIDENKTVTRVIVASQDVIDSGLFGDPASFVETFIEDKGGNRNVNPEAQKTRKNYAGRGDKYDNVRDIFIPKHRLDQTELSEEYGVFMTPEEYVEVHGVNPPGLNK